MPTHITHSGLDAHAAHHEDLGRIWLIYRAGIPHGFARQLSYNDWMHWADLEAMRIGETRCYHHGPKLETIMDRLAQEQANTRRRSESVLTTFMGKIDEMESY